MDPRRLLILAGAGLGLSGCALMPGGRPPTPVPMSTGAAVAPAETPEAPPPTEEEAGLGGAVPAVLPDPRPAAGAAEVETGVGPRADALIGAVRVFAWSPGRVYPVRTAPLRVTTLTLGPGETLVAKAAGDTVRWQIGETLSGEGDARRTHVLIKPLQRGLETNLVLTTSRRVYLLDLTSGAADGFDVAVAWDAGAVDPAPVRFGPATPIPAADPVVTPQGPLDARYRIAPVGRRPRWTPASVFNDGLRTFIAFHPDLRIDEAPALFVIAPDGQTQTVNYRQAGGLFIVDRVFDRAELRLGDRRPQVVRLQRLAGAVR